jgi:hypothetical protein
MFKSVMFAVALVVPVVAHADEPRHTYIMFGFGLASCGSWTEFRKHPYSNTSLTTWLAGYMTAFDLYGTDREDGSNGTDINGLAGWIDNYCKANPLRTTANAADALTFQLNNPTSTPKWNAFVRALRLWVFV